MRVVRACLIALFIATFLASDHCILAAPAMTAKPKTKLTVWLPLFENALKQARDQKKVILAYFGSSDGDDLTKQLEKEVLNTDLFRDWATDRVILFHVDFPKEKPLSGNIKIQADRLRTKYSIIRVPTFILMDCSGLPFARAGWDESKLRPEEMKGQPKAWIQWLETSIKNKPADEKLIKQKNLTECLAFGKKHFISAVVVISQGRLERDVKIKEEILNNQQFIQYCNRNVSFTEMEWPFDSDNSAEANAFRIFVAKNAITPAGLQLVVWDMQTNKVNMKIPALDSNRVDFLLSRIDDKLPKIDYNHGWVDDWRQAQVIAQQQKRCIFVAFMSMSGKGSEYSKKLDDEIIETEQFQKFARKHLVMMMVDFPGAVDPSAPPPPAPAPGAPAAPPTTQPVTLQAQNQTLAEMYAIRGFPSIIMLNQQGQKIGEGKYMKGGPDILLKQLEAAVRADEERRAFLAGDQPQP